MAAHRPGDVFSATRVILAASGYAGPMDSAVLDRVRKLLALAGSPNPHEAALAAQRAQALVSRHRLERWVAAESAEAEDPDPITLGRDEPLEVARKTRKWKAHLASVLADANGCRAWIDTRARKQALCVVGRKRDRDVVRALWDGLVKRVQWASATAGEGQDRAWHDAFRIGLAEQIGQKLRAGVREVVSAADRHALAVVDPAIAVHRAALERFVEQHLRPGRGRRLLVDAEGLAAGRAVGARFDV